VRAVGETVAWPPVIEQQYAAASASQRQSRR
jgi:hypothetical protein